MKVPIRAADLGTREDFAKALTRLRELRGLTVREVAAAADTPVGTVGGYLSGRHLPPLAAMDQLLRVLRVLGVPQAEIGSWVDAVNRLRRAPGRRPSGSPAPYRGLEAYEAEDAALFVGRELVTRSLVARVQAGPSEPVVVIGPSGSGKSSLLRAGLMASLQDAGREVSLVTPASLDGESGTLPGGGVLIVDQLEEAFDPSDLTAARAVVAELCEARDRGVTVVVALRADFFDRALEVDPLPEWLEHGPVLVGPLTTDELRRVIVEPARALGIEVEDALVDVLVTEAGAGAAAGRGLDAGALPLVSHALYVTWAASPGHRLALAHYREAGGLSGAVAKTAEGVYASLTVAQQQVARRTLLRLVHVRDGAPDTRRPADSREFDSAEASEVLAACIDSRLVTSDRGRVQLAHEALITAWPRLRGWLEEDRQALHVRSRLTESVGHWLAAGRNRDLLYRGSALDAVEDLLAEPADAPTLTESERDFLEASRAAEQARARARRRGSRRLRGLAAALAVAAVAAGALAIVGWLQNATLHHERDLAVSRQLAVTARSLTSTDPGLASQVAVAAQGAADTLESRSALLSATAVTPVSRLAEVGGVVNAVAVSPDGTVVAAGSDASNVQLWSTDAHPRELSRLTVAGTTIFDLAFSRSGGLLVGGGDAGDLVAWDVTDPSRPVPVDVAAADVGTTIYGVATDPAGRLVAAGANDGTVHLWRVGEHGLTPAATFTAFEGTVQSVLFDGHLLAAAGSKGLLGLWDVTDPTAPVSLLTPVVAAGGQIASLDLSSDGHTLAVGSWDDTVHLWDVADPAAPVEGATLSGPSSWVNRVAFSPDGSTLAATSSDKHLWTWDVATGKATRSLPNPALLLGGAWAPDGSALYAAGADGALRVWAYPGSTIVGLGSAAAGLPLADGFAATATVDGLRIWDTTDLESPRLVSLSPAPDGVRLDGALAVSRSLGLAAAGTRSGAVYVWDIADRSAPVLLGTLTAHTTWVENVAFDPSGTRLVVGSDDTTISLWDLSAGLPTSPAAIIHAGGLVYSAYFSPDGSTVIAAVLTARQVRLYDVSDLARPTQIGAPLTGPAGYVYNAVFSPDGRIIAASGNDGSVWLWDASNLTAPTPLGSPLVWADGYATTLDFSPDGRYLAAAMTDGTVRVWDVSDVRHPTRWAALEGFGGTVYGVAFSPDGSHVAAAGADRTVRLFDTSLATARDELCRAADRGVPMTAKEWARVVGDVPFPAQCAG